MTDPANPDSPPNHAASTPHYTESTPAYRGVCPRCETSVDTDRANELVAFYRRHHRVTGHDVRVERAPSAVVDTEVDATDATGASDEPPSVGDIVRDRQAEADAGVPIGVVAAVLHAHGVAIGETLQRVHDRRLTGVLYEPSDDHLRAL